MRTLLCLLALSILPLCDAPAAEGERELWVKRVKVRLRGSVKLTARFPSEHLPAGFNPEVERLELGFGPTTLLSLPPVDDRSAFVRRDAWRLTYRERRSKDRPGVRRLRLDLAAGRLEFRAKRMDLSALAELDPEGTPVTLTLGDTVFAAELDLRVNGKGFVFRAKRVRPAPKPIDPGPPGGDPGFDAEFRMLIKGASSDVPTPENRVFRTRAEWESFRFAHPGIWPYTGGWPPGVGAPITAPPTIDWSREMVVGVFLGQVPSATYSVDVTQVRVQGSALVVTYQEVQPGPTCPVPMMVGYPFVVAAVSRTSAPVSFVRTVRVKSCP